MKHSVLVYLVIFTSILLHSCSTDSDTDDAVIYSTITIKASPKNTGTAQPVSQTVQNGGSVKITAFPEEDYFFSHWEGDINLEKNPTTVEVNKDLNIIAVFKPKFYLHENGVTVICTEAEIGETGIIKGKEYIAVNGKMLSEKIHNYGDLSEVCTSHINSAINRFAFELKNTSQNNISHWDVSNVVYMDEMFLGAKNFNADISNWDVGNVRSMWNMFSEATAFNQDISDWNVSNVEDMAGMFAGASDFNQDISDWDVSNVENMAGMFANAQSFDQDISSWDVANVGVMSGMFAGASDFNQDISNWDMSNVAIRRMFAGASNFNQDISNWDVSNVRNMEYLFKNALNFNQDISGWNLSSIIYMNGMFQNAQSFNQDISSWDVSNAREMDYMFENASNFGQDISNWCVEYITNKPEGFSTGSSLIYKYRPVWGTCPK